MDPLRSDRIQEYSTAVEAPFPPVSPHLGEARGGQPMDDMSNGRPSRQGKRRTRLERALAAQRLSSAGSTRTRSAPGAAQALELIEQYTLLLREPVPASTRRNPARYCFKLVFPDGRWSVDEKQLAGGAAGGRRRRRSTASATGGSRARSR